MGCTPSTLNSQHQLSPTAAEDGTTEASHDMNKKLTTGGSSSPRTWRFRRSGDKAIKSIKCTVTHKNSSDAKVQSKEPPLKVLLVFAKDDTQSDALWLASDRLGYECTVARSKDAATDAVHLKTPDIIIVDNRSLKNLDGEAICRALRNAIVSRDATVAAVVKKVRGELDDPSVLPYLNAGYNRVIIETSSPGVCMDELLQMGKGCSQPPAPINTQAVMLALDKCKDVIHITDSAHIIQYSNRASERLLDYACKEQLGKNLLDLHRIDANDLMVQQLQKGREWEGNITLHRRNNDTVILAGRVVPILATGRPPVQYVYIHELPPLVVDKRMSLQTGSILHKESGPRGSFHSLRKGSTDIRSIASDGNRRQSMSKLNSLSIEAPITRVITLINTAQETAPEAVSLILDKVVDMLRTTELYSPMMKEEGSILGDPVTSDLIGALLSQGGTPVSSARRSSSESATFRSNSALGMRGNFKMHKVSSNLVELLNNALSWDFDIFKLETLSTKRPLVHLGMSIAMRFDLHQSLGVEESIIHNWLMIIEANYHPENSYHNSTHAADVMQAAAAFLETERLKQILDPLDEAMCLIAAAAHDVDHPGRSSAFLCNKGHEFAVLYNDICVLESHHSALAFKLTTSDDRVNIFKGLEKDTYKVVRRSVIDMILATEMTKHFEYVAKFVNVFAKAPNDEDTTAEVESDTLDLGLATQPENIVLIKRMLIKCADVSNPARPLNISIEWGLRIAEEYFSQTDDEKANNLPVVMPMFDRTTCSIPKSQIGFRDYIVNDMFEAWENLIEMPELIVHLDNNYRFWKEKESVGTNSILDFIKKYREPST